MTGERQEVINAAQLRRWLTLLRKPDQLATTELGDLLVSRGAVPPNASTMVVGHAAASLLIDSIERLRPDDEASREELLPYLVLQTCFVDGAKLFQAASKLGLSERQLSRERTRSIELLRGELEGPLSQPVRGYRPEPIPTISGYLSRPGQIKTISAALEHHHFVNVHGPPGMGKTSLVAELAEEAAETTPVLWYRFRQGVNDTLTAVLFELGDYLHTRGFPDLARYLEQALPDVDTGVATRLALKGLARSPQIVVFDDSHLVEDAPPITSLVDEAVARLPDLRLITIGRHRYSRATGGTALEISPFGRGECRSLLRQLGVDCDPQMVKTIHVWTGGNPHLIKLAASWLKTASDDEVARGIESLNDQEEVQSFLFSNITVLLDSDDRAILEAASIFRDRFTDDALGSVSGRTRGAVLDATSRLVRVYAATRSREGGSAYFHRSIRDYVYDRLPTGRRSELHERAARWYREKGNDEEADHHARQATASGT